MKQNIEVSKDYFNKDGKIASEFKVGEQVEVSVRIRSVDEKNHAHIALVDLIPGGFEMIIDPVVAAENNDGGGARGGAPSVPADQAYPEEEGAAPEMAPEGEEGVFFKVLPILIPKAYAQTVTAKSALTPLAPDFVDKRDDRVVVYTTVTPEFREYRYKIKAVNEGDFTRPPAFAEGMYDRSKKYIGKMEIVKVTK